MNKVIFVAVLITLLVASGEATAQPAKIEKMNQMEVVNYWLTEHDQNRDTYQGSYELMVAADAFTSGGSRRNINENYFELRLWVEKHANYPVSERR